MITHRGIHSSLGLLLALLAGCSSVDPGPSFEAVRHQLAGRHPGELAWARSPQQGADFQERVDELLASPLGPNEAAEISLLRNPLLQATLEELGIAQADLAQASRLANPGVALTRLTGAGATQTTFSLTADLVDWLTQPLRRRLAEADAERVRLEVGHAVLTTVAEARLALVRFQAAAEVERQQARIEEIREAAAEYARALHAAGNLTALELARMEAEAVEARAERRREQAETAQRRQEVALALGLEPEQVWTAAAVSPPPEARFDPSALEDLALAHRLDLAAARQAVAMLERALALKRRTRLSPVGIEAGVERERDAEGVVLTGPVVELRLPVFDTGKASVARLKAELAQARWQLAALTGAVRARVRQAAEEALAGRELVQLYSETLLPLRRDVVARSLLEYNQMLIGSFDLLAARQEEAEAERKLTEAVADYWQAHFELEETLGTPLPETTP